MTKIKSTLLYLLDLGFFLKILKHDKQLDSVSEMIFILFLDKQFYLPC